MKVSELGEFGLVDLLAKQVSKSRNPQFTSWRQLILGIGDDAAAWRGNNLIQLATVDSLNQNIHFTLDMTSWYELGWKSLAINLSDIAAMGGIPKYALVCLTLPDDTEVSDVIDLYKGMLELAQQFEVAVVGGDTNRASLVSITTTVLGNNLGRGKPVLPRSAAKVGDQIAVTGYLGAAAAGLQVLMNKLQFSPEATTRLREAFSRPLPRIAEGKLLVEHGVKTAIDISDGLISDLRHVCQASRVGARVAVDRVPIHPDVKANFGARALELALSGGEDYELLFTGSPDVIAKVKKVASCPITVIGEIIADKSGKISLVDKNNKPFSLRASGWEHFRGE